MHQTSLFLTSLPPTATEESIRAFYTSSIPEATLKSVVLVPTSRVAVRVFPASPYSSLTSRRSQFVNFIDRKAAEMAAGRSAVNVVIEGANVKCQWGRSRPKKVAPSEPATGPISVVAEREFATSGK